MAEDNPEASSEEENQDPRDRGWCWVVALGKEILFQII